MGEIKIRESSFKRQKRNLKSIEKRTVFFYNYPCRNCRPKKTSAWVALRCLWPSKLGHVVEDICVPIINVIRLSWADRLHHWCNSTYVGLGSAVFLPFVRQRSFAEGLGIQIWPSLPINLHLGAPSFPANFTANCQLYCQLPTANCQLPTANCQLPTQRRV
jgi:hypothetical protein